MQKAQRIVERTCISCRTKDAQKKFVRYVVGPDRQLVVDYRHRLPGRGAYTCIDRKCIIDAIEKKSFSRALRQAEAVIDQATLLDTVAAAISQRITGLLGIARKAGDVVTGTSMLQSALARGDISYLVIAEDAADGSVAKITRLADEAGVAWARFSTQAELGQIAGRENRNCAGIKNKQFAELMALEINRLQQIAGEN